MTEDKNYKKFNYKAHTSICCQSRDGPNENLISSERFLIRQRDFHLVWAIKIGQF